MSSTFNITITAPVAAGPRLSAGYQSTCGVTTGGGAYCWGANEWAQLGNGSLTGSLIPSGVSGGLSFASVSVGSFHPTHTCGVTTSGAAYCWGADSLGELGNGSPTAYSLTPVAVSGGLSFAAVSGGARFTCGVTTSGAGYCWGDNGYGALGNGSNVSNSTTPVAVVGGLSFATVSAGFGQTCGVTTSGAAYCWGNNQYGQLGIGSTSPTLTPLAVSGGLSFASVSAGTDFTCGVTTGGAAYCWGHPGALGNGTATSSAIPVAVSGGLSF